ncbi:MAG: hypothetical protein PPP58_03445 [Natronomonas sp.]
MSVAELCELCQTGTIEDGCDRCGRLVCETHYDESTGLCTDCAAEMPERDREETREYPDGVEEFRF